MPTLPPKIAVQLASLAYDIKDPINGRYTLNSPDVERNFSFDLSNGPIKGVSGSIFSRLLNRKTGFAIVGTGKEQFKDDHVISIRGTDGLEDAITDGHFGLTVADNNALIHAGFNKTFQSIKPALESTLTPLLSKSSSGIVHCVGHSLGGALAHLTADWVKHHYKNKVFLYSFGAPRVGLDSFSIKSTNSIDKIFRCTHASDPVPMVPLWPYVHAPYQGSEILLASGDGIRPEAHKMSTSANPGYLNTANSSSWRNLQQKSSLNLATVRLDYQNRYQASFSGYWADRISAGLITLLKDAGYYAAVMGQATIGTGLTFYDLLARALEGIAKASVKFGEQTKGLLGHMLVFAGQVVTEITELSYKFIKWVLDKTIGALYNSARQAMDNL
ncbi:lipase (class 3) [Shewanella putrefaciens]|nr:lipase (class 3) [Shewanella putrefaciens]